MYYFLEKKLRINRKIPVFKGITEKLIFSNKVVLPQTWMGENRFQFLNLEKDFEDIIDWNYAEYGKLWTYNLNYFEWLMQEDISVEDGLKLIHIFINHYDGIKDGLESFPISLRLLNWIKFISENDIQDARVNQVIHQDAWRLYHHPEYHLLGNHLLENGFGLFFAACYLSDKKMLKKAKSIIVEQLEEQILPDGGHFELSPMYHQHMLFRVLDCIQLIQNNGHCSRHLLPLLTDKAEKMLGWLASMTFDDGAIPLFNDSANGIAPTSHQLFQYADYLEIKVVKTVLKDSGYRRMKNDRFDCIVDVGNIGPDYIPGHAHADTLNFELYAGKHPWIVDPGISTYEDNSTRHLERSTAYHNTVTISGRNTSEMWKAFRVARREVSQIITEDLSQIEAQRTDIYQTTHARSWTLTDHTLTITDISTSETQAYFHFHPDVTINIEANRIYTNYGWIEITGHTHIALKTYSYCMGFNQTKTSQKIVITFSKNIKTQFFIEDTVS